jgi:hypothetical protein
VNTTTVNTATTPAINAAIKSMPFDGFVFFHPIVNNYTGSKKLTAKDIGLRPDQLPPTTLAKLGQIASCDPSKLAKGETFRAAQRNLLLKKGTRVMGLFAVHADEAGQVAIELDKITSEFYDWKETELLATFESDRDKWLSDPEFAPWVAAIKARLDPIGHIEKKIQCDWYGFTIGTNTELSEAASSALHAGMERARNGVGDTVLEEIAVIASTTFRTSMHDDNGNKVIEVTRRILSPIKRIKEKLDALSFADPKLNQVVRYIDSVLVLLPSTGKLSSDNLNAIYSLLHVLSDPQTIQQFAFIGATASAVMTSDDAQQVLDIVTPVVQPLAQVQAGLVEFDVDVGDPTTQPLAATASVDTAPAVVHPEAKTEDELDVVYDV